MYPFRGTSTSVFSHRRIVLGVCIFSCPDHFGCTFSCTGSPGSARPSTRAMCRSWTTPSSTSLTWRFRSTGKTTTPCEGESLDWRRDGNRSELTLTLSTSTIRPYSRSRATVDQVCQIRKATPRRLRGNQLRSQRTVVRMPTKVTATATAMILPTNKRQRRQLKKRQQRQQQQPWILGDTTKHFQVEMHF